MHTLDTRLLCKKRGGKLILSRLILDWRSLKKLGIRDEYGLHKLVYSLFPGNFRDFLFYDEPQAKYGKSILILSHTQPLLPQFGKLESKHIPDSYLDWNEYAFQVMINTCKRSKEGKLVPITSQENVIEWFKSKQSSWGFAVKEESFEVFDCGAAIIAKGKTNITLSKACFRGVLIVTDRDAFKHSFEKGIGKGKSFGFGLLQLKKIN